MIKYQTATTEHEYKIAKALFEEYALSLKIDLSFQRFEDELLSLQTMYGFPNGGIILAMEGSAYAGCIAVRRINEVIGEVKRMYVIPSYRGKKIGASLLEHALQLAKDCGYKKLKLDTLNDMFSAMSLYKDAGFYETAAYYPNPNENAVYFEKILYSFVYAFPLIIPV